MLRVSAMTTETEIEISAVGGDEQAAERGIEFGLELMKFAENVALRDAQGLVQSRQALLNVAGPKVLVDAAGVAANFQRMVRIADAIGIPVDDMESEIGQQVRQELTLERFASAQNTLSPNRT
jgi:hypothetical protein